MRILLRNINKVTAKGRVYYYHRPTGLRLPDNPHSPEFLSRLTEINREAGNHVQAKADPSRSRARAMVYFAQDGNGAIKIGLAWRVEQRLQELQISQADKLTLLASCPGGPRRERELHKKFAAHHIRGEWFKPAPELIAYIETVK